MFVDRTVDPRTGTILLEAGFPNPGGIVRPGQYGRVRAAVDLKKDAILVPQRAVLEMQGIDRVAVVKADNTIEFRQVETGQRIGTLWVIDSGLAAGERIVVEGLQKLRPGVTVSPETVTISDTGMAAPSAAGEAAPSARELAMSNFFIRRPIVAIVIAIIIVLLGLNSLRGLSFEQYPFLAPPIVRIIATYAGASAVAVEQSVATPIEQEVNGVEGMVYMKSSNTSDGRMQLDVSFEVGTDQDMANVLTQNRVSSAQARLPQEVIQQGVTVKKQSPSILMLISLYSPNGSYDSEFLINYCGINLRDQILRIPGIAQVDLFGGTDYGMRIWLEPDKLAKLALTPSDVITAIKEQNLQAPAGRIGMRPSPRTRSSPTR